MSTYLGGCESHGRHHSSDLFEIHHGTPEPTYLCGYHYFAREESLGSHASLQIAGLEVSSWIIRALAVSAFGAWLLLGLAHGSESIANQHVNPGISPCVAEDGPGPCYWDSRTRGNGLGRSFVMDAEGNVSYR